MRDARAAIYGSRPSFARATGLSVSLLSELERGIRSNFSAETTGRVEHALGWAPGAIRDLAAGKRLRRIEDQDLARLLDAWPHLSPDARVILADLAQRGLQAPR